MAWRWNAEPTLVRRLLLALLPPLLLVALAGAALDYLQVRRLADEAYDHSLASTAIGLAARPESDRDGDLPVHLSALSNALARRLPQVALRHVVQAADGRIVSGEAALLALAVPAAPGPAFGDAQLDGRPVRVATYRYDGPEGAALIPAAAVPGFNYSAAMKDAGLSWTPEALSAYLAAPRLKLPGGTMKYDGLAAEADRADLIAYLATTGTPK